MPNNGIGFLRWLRKENPDLSGVKFAMLGLGDTNYTTYQKNPRTLFNLLVQRGAFAFLPLEEADE